MLSLKKRRYTIIAVLVVSASLQGCVSKNDIESNSEQSVALEAGITENLITKEMAYEGVSNYCHEMYDWSIAEDNPSIMYLEMEEESEAEHQVIFRSYTGTIVYFYVDKSNGNTKITEYVPALDAENDAGTISIYDYLKNTS